MASDRVSTLTLLLLVPCVALWDAQLTDKLFGEQNRKIAADAEAAGEQNWTEMGVGVDANGEAYIQPIARGKVFKHIRAGLLLVATGQVDGSIFDTSVILLVKHDGNGTLGLILNKPAPFPADEHLEPSEIIEETYGATPKNPRSLEHIGIGGPVGTGTALYLHGGPPPGSTRRCYADGGGGVHLVDSNGQPLPLGDDDEPPPEGEQILPGVHFMSSGAYLRCALRDSKGPHVRTFLGHSGWGAQQLDGEWRRGSWMLCEATAETVFAPDVSKLWEELSFGATGVTLCSRVPQSDDTWSERKMAAPG